MLDPETQNHIDARIEENRARNDEQFAQIMARLDNIPNAREVRKQHLGTTITLAAAIMIFFAFTGYHFEKVVKAALVIFDISDQVQKTVEKNEDNIISIKQILEDMNEDR